jgi:hypothetical protein
MENGKPAGVRCVQLTDENRCGIFASNLRPAVCDSLRPDSEMCGSNMSEAMQILSRMEQVTLPQDG